MNTLETRSVPSSELSRGLAASEPRVVKKYPNRRLYDTVESRYITLADIRRLVLDRVDFVVIDKKSQDDITRSILLQVIADQEHAGEPLMSQVFLAQVIRCYGGTTQGLVGNYLEQSLKLLCSQQSLFDEHAQESADVDEVVASLTEQNLERWRSMQEDILKATTVGLAASHGDGADAARDEAR